MARLLAGERTAAFLVRHDRAEAPPGQLRRGLELDPAGPGGLRQQIGPQLLDELGVAQLLDELGVAQLLTAYEQPDQPQHDETAAAGDRDDPPERRPLRYRFFGCTDRWR
ncbi:hypothetical protein [Micromonospora sp. LOL_021]|uniref:hypothetical protein n=1 Tax=Micromonospora sp. LOL_021 TaxID=3345417 RepID=UPI003A8C1B4C